MLNTICGATKSKKSCFLQIRDFTAFKIWKQLRNTPGTRVGPGFRDWMPKWMKSNRHREKKERQNINTKLVKYYIINVNVCFQNVHNLSLSLIAFYSEIYVVEFKVIRKQIRVSQNLPKIKKLLYFFTKWFIPLYVVRLDTPKKFEPILTCFSGPWSQFNL